jgi:PAS domain S-box-containing protein
MNIANQIFLLLFNISQLHDKQRIVELFIGGMHELFKPALFLFIENSGVENNDLIEIKTRTSSFGFIQIEIANKISEMDEILIKNAIQMLAVILENLEFDHQLQKEKNSIQQIENDRFVELQETVNELKKAKTATLNLIADLNQEIEKREEAENKLLERETNYRLLVEHQNDMVVKVDHEGKFLFVSSSYCKLFGKSEEELLGKSFFPQVHEDDIAPTLTEMKKLYVEPYTCQVVQRAMTIDGWRWLEWIDNAILDDNNNIIYIIGVGRDITDRKNAEDKLLHNNYLMSCIIENDPSAISVFDKDLRYLYVSKRFIQDYKLKETNIIGKRHYDIFPELPERWKEIHRKSLNGEILNSEDDKFLRTDGTVDYVRWECRPWYESEGTIGGIILFSEVITEQRSLQQKQLHLLNIIDNSLNEIYIFDSTTLKFEYLNRGALQNMGYTLDEIKDLTPVDIKPEFTYEKFKQTVEPLVRGEVEQLHLETIHQRKDRSTYPVEVRIQLFEQNDKKVILAIINDITERKIADESLKESEEIFSRFMENSPIYVFFKDKDIRALRLSKNFEQMLGRPLNELIGKNMDELFPSELAKSMVEDDKRILNNREMISVDEELNGRFYTTIKFPIVIDDEPRFLAGYTIDVTEQKLAEEKLKTSDRIFKHSLDMLCISGFDGFFKVLNPAWEKALGWSTEELLSKPWLAFVHPDDIEPTSNIKTVLVEGKEIFQFENRYICKDGTVKWLSWNSFPYPEEKILFGVARDISEKKKAEDSLSISEKKYRYMFENNPQPMWIYDIETLRFLEINAAVIDQYGYTREEFLSMTLRDIRPLEDVPLLELDVAQTGKELNSAGEWRHNKKNGELIHVEIISHAVIHNNRPARHVLIRDITQHKRAEMIQTMQYNIANAVINSKELDQLFNSIKDELNNLIYAKNFFIAFYNEETGMLSSFVDRDEKDEINEWSADKSLTGYVIRKNEPIILRKDDILRLHENGIIDLIGTTSEAWLGVPLMIEGKVLGAIVVQSYDNPDAYDKSSIEILELVAHELSIYIERQRAEENVVKLSKAVEQSPVSVIITDPKGNIEYVNSKFTLVTGYSLEEVKGKNPRVLQSGEKTHEDYSKLWSTILSGVEWQGEFHNKKKNGELFWENAVISPLLNQRGKITNFIAVKEDITEKKLTLERILKSEEQFRSTWENSFDGMRLSDSNGIIVEVNQAYCKLVKKEKPELLGKNLLSIYLNQDVKALERHKERFNTGHIETKLEEKVVLWNSEEKWISLSNSFIQTGEEKKLLLSIFRDISSQKEYENELVIAKDKAEEMSRVKSNFLANMSHELRTPLVAILGFSEFLREELRNNEDLTMMVDNIMKGGNRLLETVNLILNISQIESGQKQVLLNNMNIVPLLKESFDLFTQLALNAKLEYGFNHDKDVINCIIDEKLFRDIINNLLNNAIKFTDAGTVSLIAEVGNDKVIIKVIDTGIGIPREKQEVIWEEFRQASEGLSRSFEGTGLGLTLVKKYTELMKGTISLSSEVGKGSTFIIELPLALEQVDLSNLSIAANGQPIIEEIKSTQVERKKILYVEDDKISIQFVSIILSDKYYLDVATTAEEALKCINKTTYDLILMDINLSKGMDGVQLTELIRSTIPGYKDIPIIAATAYAMQSDKEEFLRRGMTGYISKPFAKRDILSLLERVMS